MPDSQAMLWIGCGFEGAIHTQPDPHTPDAVVKRGKSYPNPAPGPHCPAQCETV